MFRFEPVEYLTNPYPQHIAQTDNGEMGAYHPTMTSFGLTLWWRSNIVRWYSMSTATWSAVSLWSTANEERTSTSPVSDRVPRSVPITRSWASVRRR